MKKPKELIKQVAVAVGEDYTLMLIDDEWCLYRDLGNGYDIEVNLSGTKKLTLNATVYVWQVRDQLKVIETIEGIGNIEGLRCILRRVVNKTNRLAAKKNKVYRPILVEAV